MNVSANVSRGNGHENGNGVSHTNTTLQAGQAVGLNSGRDTTLKGAQVSGERITTDTGSQTHWYAKKTKKKKFGFGGTKTSQGKSRPHPRHSEPQCQPQ